MDPHFNIGTVYHTENIQAFAGLPNLQARYSQNPQSGSHTLPPIIPQRNAFTYSHEQLNHSSRAPQPAYPTNSSLFSNAVPFQVQNQQTAYSTNAYTQALNQPPQNASFPYRPANPYSFNQNHSQPMSGRLGELRPMPAANGTSQTPQSSSTAYTSNRPLTSSIHSSENDPTERTHVVGSQGRRGILPSAAGRPAAITNDGPATTKTTVVPVKDSDGKFPCPHCNKTYLHAKHLKRHLLRRGFCLRKIIGRLTDKVQTLETVRINVYYVSTLSHEAIFSNDISRSVRYDGEIQQVLLIYRARRPTSRKTKARKPTVLSSSKEIVWIAHCRPARPRPPTPTSSALASMVSPKTISQCRLRAPEPRA